ncbi:CCAAT/enhancer-binding protein-like [Sitodiplosis mosellana]|uniref:CCAAT/enhancer-binding protein-like n=1 Tax=Sitodiplosis mosellana TaxID=263140 RepID=UPI002444393E|nr:CCAAT/enhancer-binding protein-like [Sitodiplosis mosellana]
MGSTETMQVFENVQLMAENVLAHNMRQQQLQPQQAQQEVQQQQQQQVQHQPQQPIAEIETEMVSELQVNESVRYEMTTSRQETFLARY